MLVEVQPKRVHSSRARQRFQLSHDVLVHVCLPVIRRCERAQPGYREWVAEHHLHIHPFWLFGPSSLLLLQLFDTLQRQDVTDRRRRKSYYGFTAKHKTAHLNFNVPAENNRCKGLKIKHVMHSLVFLSEVLVRVRWLTRSISWCLRTEHTHTYTDMKML